MQTRALSVRIDRSISLFDYLILVMAIFIVSITSHTMPIEVAIPSFGNSNTHRTGMSDTLGQEDLRVEHIVVSIAPDMTNPAVTTQIKNAKRSIGTLEKKVRNDMEQEKIAAVKKYIESIVCDPNDVSKVSNLNEDDFKLLTKGTWLEGNEQALIDLEKNYHVNAFFCMAVSTLESGRGTSPRSKQFHNYFGMEVSKYFSGYYDCVQYWGNLISTSYVENWSKESVWEIGPTYCPPNREWESFMNTSMYEYYDNLISNMETTLL